MTQTRRLPRWRRAVVLAWPVATLVLLVTVLGLIAIVFGTRSQQRIITTMMIMLILVVGLYAFSGLSGILSFGHISFMGIGAYATALLTIPVAFKATHLPNLPRGIGFVSDVELGFIPAMFVAGAVAAVIGFLLSVPLTRLSGLQASLATVAVLVIFSIVAQQWEEVTRGTTTMLGIPTHTTLGSATLIACTAIVLVHLYQNSSFGRRLQATREDEEAARSLGIRVWRERIIAFTISAFLTGVGGVLWAHMLGTLAPSMFYFSITFTVVAMLIIGGMKSLAGAVIGVAVVSLLAELLRRIELNGIGPIPSLPVGFSQVMLALLLIVILIARQRGLMGGREIPVPRWLRGEGGPGQRDADARREEAAQQETTV